MLAGEETSATRTGGSEQKLFRGTQGHRSAPFVDLSNLGRHQGRERERERGSERDMEKSESGRDNAP